MYKSIISCQVNMDSIKEARFLEREVFRL